MFNEEYFSVPTSALAPEPIKISPGYALLRRLFNQKQVDLAALKTKLDTVGILSNTDIFTCYEDKGKKYYFLKDYEKLIEFLKSKKFEKEEIKEIIKSFGTKQDSKGAQFYETQTSAKIFPFLYTELGKGNDIKPYFNSLISIIKTVDASSPLTTNYCIIKWIQFPPRLQLFANNIKKIFSDKDMTEEQKKKQIIYNLEEMIQSKISETKSIDAILMSVIIITDFQNLKLLFPDWQQAFQISDALNFALKFFREKEKDLEKIMEEHNKIELKIVIKKINLLQEHFCFILENTLQIAQNDVKSILNINSIIDNELIALTMHNIEAIIAIANAYKFSVDEQHKLQTFDDLKQEVNKFNIFARENHLEELPPIKSDKKFKKDLENDDFHKLLNARLELEKKKKNYSSLVQIVLEQQTQNGIIIKADNGKYKIINQSEFDKLGPATRSLISNYLEVQVEEHESRTDTTDRLHAPEIHDSETEGDARRLVSIPPPLTSSSPP